MHTHTRRGFLAQALGPAWVGASLLEQAFFRAALARAQSPGAPTDLFEIEKVAGGVYAALARPQAFINCNGVIFENAEDLLIVDTHSKPSAAAALVAQIRRDITKKPVRYVVTTHFHWDHTQGSPAYKRLEPGAEIVASNATRSLLAEFGAARLKASLDEVPKTLDRFQQRLARANTPDQKEFFRAMVAQTRAFAEEMRDYAPVLPDVTFTDNLVIHDRAHELHLAFRGRGHTAGDVVVFCPQKKALATGDLLHCWLPFLGDGYPREWPRTLHTVAEFEYTQAVGGHGGVQKTRGTLGHFAGYIRELAEVVDASKRKGQTVEQLQAAITPGTLKSLGGGYGDFVGAQMVRYDSGSAFMLPAEALASGVKSNIADMDKALDRS